MLGTLILALLAPGRPRWPFALAVVLAVLASCDGPTSLWVRSVAASDTPTATPKGEGRADDSPAINERIKTVAAVGGGVVELEPRAYGIGVALDGSMPNITIRGVRGATKLVKLPLPSNDGITSEGHPYRGWTFDGIEFDGNGREILRGGIGYYYSLPFSGARGLRFDRCTFRDMLRGVILRDSEDIVFLDCDFLGTRPGMFAPGTWDPPAVADARLGEGLEVWSQVRDLAVSRCRFRFCASGLGVSVAVGQSGRNFAVSDCRFVADWWDMPGATLRFMPSKVATPGGLRITRAAGGLKAAFGHNEVVTFQRELAAGKAFTRLHAGNVGVEGEGFRAATPGDVIETTDGKRARVGAVESPSVVNVEGWEAIDCYEACPPPSQATAWRLVRYYATGTTPVSDTEVSLYCDPVNPFTGERAVADVRMDLTRHAARALVKTNYSGLHINAGVVGLSIKDNDFRGSWADQCSVFNCPGVQISGNTFSHGQDEGITLAQSPGSVVAGNRFTNSGVSAIYIGESRDSVIASNAVRNWGLVNPTRGAIDGGGKGLAIVGNVFAVEPRTNRGWSRHAISLMVDSTGTSISGNVDGGTTLATLSVDKRAAPKKNAVTARDVRSVVGTGRGNVSAR